MIKSFIWAIVETQIARWETKWPMQGPQLITYQFTRSFYISEGPHTTQRYHDQRWLPRWV